MLQRRTGKRQAQRAREAGMRGMRVRGSGGAGSMQAVVCGVQYAEAVRATDSTRAVHDDLRACAARGGAASAAGVARQRVVRCGAALVLRGAHAW